MSFLLFPPEFNNSGGLCIFINIPAPRGLLCTRLCSLIPGLGVKLSANILAGPTVLSAVGASPPHDGVRRRWCINVASAVSLVESSQTIRRSHHRHRPGRDVFFPPRRGNPEVSLC